MSGEPMSKGVKRPLDEIAKRQINADITRAYTDISGRYDRGRGERGTIKLVEDVALRAVRENCAITRESKLLEVGCGTGRIITGLLQSRPLAVGLDYTLAMLEKGKPRVAKTPRITR